jgi:cytochrome P450
MNQSFPLGAAVDPATVERDLYAVFAQLRVEEPATWVEKLRMWWVVRHDDVHKILFDTENFVTGTPGSVIYDTFGAHMLTTEGAAHAHQRGAFRGAFSPGAIRVRMEVEVARMVGRLIDGFAKDGRVELRSAFASRLPVLSMLALFGFDEAEEAHLRQWYDAFEAALANFTWDQGVRERAWACRDAFHALIQQRIDAVRAEPGDDLMSQVVHAQGEDRLTDEEIRNNAGIIFFGGISTVEALILNAVYALCTHPEVFARLRADPSLTPAVIEETVRWLSPVQSATRHAVNDVVVAGVQIAAGDTVNCMLGAANHDPDLFPDPERFDIDRPNGRRHLGFAVGPHFCLGSHLARLEGRTAIERFLARLPNLRLDPAHTVSIHGYEFRQPRELHLLFDPA